MNILPFSDFYEILSIFTKFLRNFINFYEIFTKFYQFLRNFSEIFPKFFRNFINFLSIFFRNFSEMFPFFPHSYKKNIFFNKINSKNQYKKPRTQCNKQSIHYTNSQYKSIQPIFPKSFRNLSIFSIFINFSIYVKLYQLLVPIV